MKMKVFDQFEGNDKHMVVYIAADPLVPRCTFLSLDLGAESLADSFAYVKLQQTLTSGFPK